MARPSSLSPALHALVLAAGEALAQDPAIHGAPAHPQDVLPRPEPRGVDLASRPTTKRRRGSAATSALARADGDGDAGTGANGEARASRRARQGTEADRPGPSASGEFSEEGLRKVRHSLPWWIQEAEKPEFSANSVGSTCQGGEPHASSLPQMRPVPGSGGLPATLLPCWCLQPGRAR